MLRPDSRRPVGIVSRQPFVKPLSPGKALVDPVRQDNPHDAVAVEKVPLGPDELLQAIGMTGAENYPVKTLDYGEKNGPEVPRRLIEQRSRRPF